MLTIEQILDDRLLQAGSATATWAAESGAKDIDVDSPSVPALDAVYVVLVKNGLGQAITIVPQNVFGDDEYDGDSVTVNASSNRYVRLGGLFCGDADLHRFKVTPAASASGSVTITVYKP